MPNTQLGDSQQVSFQIIELDEDKAVVEGLATDSITLVSSDTDSMTVVQDPTPAPGTVASGFLVGGSKVQTGVTFTATVNHQDGTSISAVDTLDIVAGGASSVSISLGTPGPKTPAAPVIQP